MHSVSLLVVEDAGPRQPVLELLAKRWGFHCEATGWRTFKPESLLQAPPSLAVLVADPLRPEVGELLDWLEINSCESPLLAVLPVGGGSLLERAASLVEDFVMSPIREEELRRRLERLLPSELGDVQATQEALTIELGLAQLVGRAPVFVAVLDRIPALAMSDAAVLIVGETGTGKELCAQAIHHLSPRRDRPFVPVDCGAIPEQLFESELFGHTRGAFTDAFRDHKGLAATADGGTLFLDEVDALSLAAQAKLLRFLQDRRFKRLGEERFTQADVRVLAATNRNLAECVRDGRFRPDLYYRLNVLQVRLPALRERRPDIEALATHFLQKTCRSKRRLSRAALHCLSMYDWPGNVRELANAVQRADIMAGESEWILPKHISFAAELHPESCSVETFRDARTRAIEQFERDYLVALLRKHGGNITHAAREAGKERRAFGRLVKKYRVAAASSLRVPSGEIPTRRLSA